MANLIVCTPAPRSGGQSATAVTLGSGAGMDSTSVARRLIEATRANTADARSTVISVVKANAWGARGKRLTTSFMDNPSPELRREILRHLNMWNQRANIEFVESNVDSMVRIDRRTGARWGGYWSYVGTEILNIPADEPTMNFEAFTINTPQSEFRRVVCHEAGHTLGFPHEHMRKAFVERIDPQKAYAYFLRTDGWSEQDVRDQVLTPLDARTLLGTRPDQTSIMCYQLPGSIMRDGQPIPGGNAINETDYEFAATLYPLPKQTSGRATTKKTTKRTTKTAAKRKTAKKAAKKKTAKKTARKATKKTAKKTAKKTTGGRTTKRRR
jgi:hypothetical protein